MNPQHLTTPPSTSTPSESHSSSSSRLHIPTRSVSTSLKPPKTRPRRSDSASSSGSSSSSSDGVASKRPRSSFHHRPQASSVAADTTSIHPPTPALTPQQFESDGSRSHDSTSKGGRGETLEPKTAEQLQHESMMHSLQIEKDRFVNSLVSASVLAIESIWGPSSSSPSSSSPSNSSSSTRFSTASSILPLDYFVREVLRRSRTSCSTLQLALYYLHKARKEIRDAVEMARESRQEVKRLAESENERLEAGKERRIGKEQVGEKEEEETGYPSPPESPQTPRLPSLTSDDDSDSDSDSLSSRLYRLLSLQKSPLLCGRRMFLASLISASKYLQDRNYSNRAWSKISGLDVKEINENERKFLGLVGWELHLKAEDFRRWTERLGTLTSSVSATLTGGGGERKGLGRTASEYLPAPETITSTLPPPTTTSSIVAPQGLSSSDNLVRSKLALTRGSSAPQLDSTRSFPIAQPLSRPAQEGTEMESTEEEVNIVVAPVVVKVEEPKRKVRALPLRRSKLLNNKGSGVPANWGARSTVGGVVGGRGLEHQERFIGGGELISVH
ncbi:cyclin family protein [Sporobolomyces salmoneus]|uniref:cyclin family protein n=1 Tax=Sporobolomyces salmoneus TaxID=183962 RepID=UPI003180826C